MLQYGEMISKQEITDFQNHILDWYAQNKRSLPWRELKFDPILKAREPYKIFISEVMAQQTQLSRVIPKYLAWLEVFPTVESLAKADTSEVLRMWSGLGYNRRALNMKKAAEKIINEFNGNFPNSEKDLLSLPGIGQYTARAILCFAFDQQVAVVDTNVRRVILTQVLKDAEKKVSELRLHDAAREKMITETEMEEIAQTLLPQGMAYEWNQALMDYSAAMLREQKISIPKQSKFHGSHRQYRGRVLKVLLEKKKVSVDQLGSLIKEGYTDVEKDWLQKLLDELVKEGFVIIENDSVILAS